MTRSRRQYRRLRGPKVIVTAMVLLIISVLSACSQNSQAPTVTSLGAEPAIVTAINDRDAAAAINERDAATTIDERDAATTSAEQDAAVATDEQYAEPSRSARDADVVTVNATRDGARDADDGSAGSASPLTPDSPASTLVSEPGALVRIRIPALSVDAPIVELGFNADGLLDVPSDGATVGWYSVSAEIGAPGSALLGGHRDWAGAVAVFYRLGDLSSGDLIHIERRGELLVYQVQSVRSVQYDTPLSDVLDGRSVSSTLTLFTCGGNFDRGLGQYDERVIVVASQVPATALAID